MSEPNSGEPIELPDTEVALLVEAEGESQDEIADNLVEQLLLLWAAFAVLGIRDSGSAFYDGLSVQEFGQEIGRLVVAAQRAAGQVTEAHLREQIELMGFDLPRTTLVDLPDDLRMGAETSDVYQRPIREIRYLHSVEDIPLDEAAETARDRLERQALTDLQLARTISAQQVLYRFPEATGWRRIIHPELGNVCGLCIAASDRVYRRIEKMDLHPGCVVEGTEVSAAGVGAATRRWYAGPVTVLRTASGEELRLTGNHPVLTDQGWVAADRLRKGDRVVRHSGSHRNGRRGPDEQQRPARVEDLWRALTVAQGLLPRTVPLAPEDLHGDGAVEGEVDVVLVDRHLPDVGRVSFIQPCRELDLVGAGSRGLLLPGQRTGTELFDRLLTPAHSFVSVGQQSLAFAGGHPGETETIGFGLRADRYFSAPESTEDGGAGYAEVGGQLLDRLTGEVEFSELVEVDVVAWSGHVYNFQTVEGWYASNHLVVSNCKCTVLPIVGGLDPGNTLNKEDLRRLYEAAGSTATEALREIRVEVKHNGELGPILTPKQVEMRGPGQVKRQLSDRAKQLRREQLERQIAELEARPQRSQWFDDRIEQLQELLRTA